MRYDGRAGQHRTSPCETHCPLGNPIQKIERALAKGNPALALRLLRAVTPFPGVTGRVCPHPCEKACNRAQYDQALSICALERHAADAGAAEFKRIHPLPDSGKNMSVHF